MVTVPVFEQALTELISPPAIRDLFSRTPVVTVIALHTESAICSGEFEGRTQNLSIPRAQLASVVNEPRVSDQVLLRRDESGWTPYVRLIDPSDPSDVASVLADEAHTTGDRAQDESPEREKPPPSGPFQF